MRLLVVEDEAAIAHFVCQGLTESGYAVDVAYDGREGWDYARAAEYDALVVDIMLPKMTGLELLAGLRQSGMKTPVLMLTARDTLEDCVAGLDAGADDYLVKPFAFPELLARLRALLRRPALQVGPVLEMADLQMDTARHQVVRAGETIPLSPREYAVLEYLLRHPNQVLSRTQIGEHVWNFDFFNESNVIDVYVGYLRRKIDRDHPLKLIHTVRGVGFRLSADI